MPRFSRKSDRIGRLGVEQVRLVRRRTGDLIVVLVHKVNKIIIGTLNLYGPEVVNRAILFFFSPDRDIIL